MRALHLTPLLIALASPAFGQDVLLQHCRAVADPSARLACYDALAAAPVAARTPDSFGLPAAQRPEEQMEVRSAVGARFGGWGPNTRIRLDNGQVWQVIDGSSVSMPEQARKVTVKRGSFGSFHLDFEDLKTSPRVRRAE